MPNEVYRKQPIANRQRPRPSIDSDNTTSDTHLLHLPPHRDKPIIKSQPFVDRMIDVRSLELSIDRDSVEITQPRELPNRFPLLITIVGNKDICFPHQRLLNRSLWHERDDTMAIDYHVISSRISLALRLITFTIVS